MCKWYFTTTENPNFETNFLLICSVIESLPRTNSTIFNQILQNLNYKDKQGIEL